jgi:hypothetical protein
MRSSLRIVLGLAVAFLVSPSSGGAPPDQPAKPPANTPTAEESAGKEFAATAAWLEKAYAGTQPPESVRMFIAISRGSMMGPGEGWFGPAQSRYSWNWLAHRHGVDPGKGIPAQQFRGSKEWFARLDRNRDGILSADDFDWSDSSAFVRQMGQAQQWLSLVDSNGDRKLSKAEWDALFQKVSQGKEFLDAEDVRALLFPTQPRPLGLPSGMPSKAILFKGLLSGELGSPREGPHIGDVASDFTLKSPDGLKNVQLSKLIGPKPLVLIFGSFT